MNSHSFLNRGVASVYAISVVVALLANFCVAQPFTAADYATNSAYASGWGPGTNGGFGFGAWDMTGTSGSPVQWGMDNSSPFNQLGTAWTLFNVLNNDLVKAMRPLVNPLQVGQVVSIVFDNPEYVRQYRGFTVGFLSSGVERLSVWRYWWNTWNPGTGGNPDGFWQTSSQYLTSLTTTNTSQGVRLDVTLTGANEYALTMTPLDHPELAWSETGTLANSGAIDQIQFVFYDNASDPSSATDFYISTMTIATGPPVAPHITKPPSSTALYAGRTAHFNVESLGTSLTYQWRKSGADLFNGGNISGAQAKQLIISNISTADVADYTVVITNSLDTVTSTPPATLTLVPPPSTRYENAVVSANPSAYWRLNETGDPSSGTLAALDYVGGYSGVYGSACSNKFNGVLGPQAADGFPIFEAGNGAMQSTASTDKSWVTLPTLNLNTDHATITGWIYPIGAQADWSGLIYSRSSGPADGMSYNGGGNLSYTWNNNDQATWGWDSGLTIPSDQWSFIALVVEPTQATLYLYNTNGQNSAVNAISHGVEAWSADITLGADPNNSVDRTFNGKIDEVAIFNRALSPEEILDLYNGLGNVTLSFQRSGAKIILSWPQGTLLEAGSLGGPWATNSAASPYTNTPSGDKKYYRVRAR